MVRWEERPALRAPVLVCAFRGWNDAGEAATSALDWLDQRFDADEFARIDPEEFFDFTAVRPTVRLVDGEIRTVEWPEWVLRAARIEGADSDLVLLQGVEPSLRWRTFCETIVSIAGELGVERVVSLGALLADVPHTRPVAITGIASDEALVDRHGFNRSGYEGPTGVVGVLHSALADAGLSAVSLWASVPHYVAATPNPKAALALIRGFEAVTGLAVEAGELEDEASDYERQVSAAVASDSDVKEFVERLEQAMDEVGDEVLPDELPSADTIARDFQKYLRQQRPE